MELRTGLGYDIHKLIKKRAFILGNIIIPFKKGFKAHSDGDVLIHSIVDSLLGAANMGDIGTLFPDNDIQYKDINSSILLEKVIEKISKTNYKIINIDATIICEKPKLQKHIPLIKKRLSELMKIGSEKISIKAKTKEKVDAVGKGRACEVFTSCLLMK